MDSFPRDVIGAETREERKEVECNVMSACTEEAIVAIKF